MPIEWTEYTTCSTGRTIVVVDVTTKGCLSFVWLQLTVVFRWCAVVLLSFFYLKQTNMTRHEIKA